jgi:hypothetical protein
VQNGNIVTNDSPSADNALSASSRRRIQINMDLSVKGRLKFNLKNITDRKPAIGPARILNQVS